MGYLYVVAKKALGIQSGLDSRRWSMWEKVRDELDCWPGFAKREDDTQRG